MENTESMKETEGYVLIGIGEKYLKLVENLVASLRKFGDNRPVHIIDSVDETDPLYKTCRTPFERGGTYPKIHLDKNLPFDHNIFIDADALCVGDTQQVWDLFRSSDQYIQQLGCRYDRNYHGHWYEHEVGHPIPRVHGGCIYINKNKLDPEFFPYLREYVFPNYTKIFHKSGLPYKNSRPDQPMFSLAFGKFGLQPIYLWTSPVMTVVETKRQLPFNKVYFIQQWGEELDTHISFAHIFKGQEGIDKNIQTGDEKLELTHYEQLLSDVMNFEV